MSYLFGGTPFDGYGRDGRRSLNMGGGGGGGSTQSTATSYNTNIPEYAQPYVNAMLNATQQQLFNVQDGQVTGFAPYVPYSANPADYVAEFSPMQNQAFQSAANLQTPKQFGTASTMANQAGQGALGTTGTALGYGAQGAALGQQAAGAGAQYQRTATDPNSIQAYMNPYVQASLAPQLQLMNQQLALQQQKNQAQAVGQGAYGGSRQAVQQGLDQQNADLAKQQLIAQGYNQAFNQAQQAQQFGANLGLQGLQAGMQGAQVGLQGVQGAQAGYGLTNQAAGTLGQLGTSQLAAQQGIIGLQNQLGTQQQTRQQQIINQAIQDYANAQQYPLMQLGTMSNMLRGLPLQSSTTQQYIAQPNTTTQAIGALGTGASLYGAMKAKGGAIKEKKMAKGGIASYDVGGAIEADLYDMPVERLQKEMQSPSAEVRKMARRIMAEKSIEGKAGGGIIAFAGGTPDPEVIPVEQAPQQTAMDTQYQAAPAPQQAAPAPQRAAPTPAPAAGIMKADPRALVMQTAQQALTAGDRSLEDIYAEMQKGRAPDTARQEYRSKIMEERANARDEDSRQNWLRAAQFFASWGSLPGNTLAAGMQALKGILPDVMSDRKEQKKYMREIDKTLYSLDEATRLEQNGLWDKAAELKQKLGEEKFKILGPLSTMYSADVHAAASRAAAGRETDMKARYNVKLEELTNGDPSKATPAQKAAAMEWASNITLPGQKLDYKRVEDANKAVTDSEKNGTISNLEKSRRLALVQAGTPEEKKAVNEDYDRRIADTKAEIFNRYATGGGQQAAPAPATAAPAPASYTKDSVTVGSKTYTRPENFTDAQWKAYKDSVGAK